MARRVRALLAARREATIWRLTVASDTPQAYWSYLRRYLHGPHRADALRRLALRAYAAEPPASFAPIDYDVPAPAPEELPYVERPALEFADADFPPPPPLPIYFLPPPPVELIELAPPLPAVEILALPIPVFVPIPVWCHRPGHVAPPPENVIFNNIHNRVAVDQTTRGVTIRSSQRRDGFLGGSFRSRRARARGGAAGLAREQGCAHSSAAGRRPAAGNTLSVMATAASQSAARPAAARRRRTPPAATPGKTARNERRPKWLDCGAHSPFPSGRPGSRARNAATSGHPPSVLCTTAAHRAASAMATAVRALRAATACATCADIRPPAPSAPAAAMPPPVQRVIPTPPAPAYRPPPQSPAHSAFGLAAPSRPQVSAPPAVRIAPPTPPAARIAPPPVARIAPPPPAFRPPAPAVQAPRIAPPAAPVYRPPAAGARCPCSRQPPGAARGSAQEEIGRRRALALEAGAALRRSVSAFTRSIIAHTMQA